MIEAAFDKQRFNFVQSAIEETLKWCVSPDQRVGKHQSDQYWLIRLASGAEPLQTADVRQFLRGFQLSRWARWDEDRTAAVVDRFRGTPLIARDAQIRHFSTALGACTRRGGRQTSAASKFAMFAKANAEIFIWDQLASRSARLRDACRTGARLGSLRNSRPYVDDAGTHSYTHFARACAAALAEERKLADFACAVDQVISALAAIDGPMKSLNRDFIERRILDKLMFSEGKWIRAHHSQIQCPC